MIFFFNQLCLILSQPMGAALVSKQSENCTLMGKVPCKARNMPRDFTLINSCSQGARKFTDPVNFRESASNEGEPRAPPQKAQNQGYGLQSALGRFPGPQGHSFNLGVEEQSSSRNHYRAEQFCPRPEASKVLFQSRFLFFRVCLLLLTLCPQPPCLPFPNAPPLATFIKKKKKGKK